MKNKSLGGYSGHRYLDLGQVGVKVSKHLSSFWLEVGNVSHMLHRSKSESPLPLGPWIWESGTEISLPESASKSGARRLRSGGLNPEAVSEGHAWECGCASPLPRERTTRCSARCSAHGRIALQSVRQDVPEIGCCSLHLGAFGWCLQVRRAIHTPGVRVTLLVHLDSGNSSGDQRSNLLVLSGSP